MRLLPFSAITAGPSSLVRNSCTGQPTRAFFHPHVREQHLGSHHPRHDAGAPVPPKARTVYAHHGSRATYRWGPGREYEAAVVAAPHAANQNFVARLKEVQVHALAEPHRAGHRENGQASALRRRQGFGQRVNTRLSCGAASCVDFFAHKVDHLRDTHARCRWRLIVSCIITSSTLLAWFVQVRLNSFVKYLCP